MNTRRTELTGIALKRVGAGILGARFGLVSSQRRRAVFARQARLAFQEAGPSLIKFGQLISVRPDVFGPELIFEMESLRDRVPALSADQIRGVIEREFGARIQDLFASFDDDPVASASIAQVHRATLRQDYQPTYGDSIPAGTVLAVKVVRPGVEETVSADIGAVRPLVGMLADSRRLSHLGLEGLMGEFASSVRSECDLRIEGRHGDRLGFEFRDDPLVVVPRTVWTRTSRSVLTSEFIEGWRLSELDDVKRAGIDGHALALHGAQAFLRQVLELGRFHADLHPANMFVTPDGRICYLDFGITGQTTPAQRRAIAQVLVATVYRDADRALRYSAELGLRVPQEREAAVRERVAILMDETLAAPPRDVRGFALGFLRILDAERIVFPAEYGLLVKALVTVEGVARALYPDIDIVEAASEFAVSRVATELLTPARLIERTPAAVRAALQELAR